MKNKLIIVEISDSWMFLNNNKRLWHELMEDWISMWTLCPAISILLYSILKDKWVIYRISILILPVWAITLIRRKVKSLALFLLLNLLNVFIALLVGQSIFERIVYMLLIVIVFGNSFKKRYSEGVNYYSMKNFLFCEVFLGICYIITFNFKFELLASFVTFGGIIVALSSVLYVHLTRTEKLMEWETEFAQKFTERLKKLKVFFSSIVVIVMLAILWLMWQSGIFQLLDKLQSYINSIFIPKPQMDRPLPVPQKQAPKTEMDMMEGLKNLGGESSPNIFIEIIMKVIEIIIIISVVIVLVYLLWMFILKLRELYHQFYLKAPKNEKREFVITAEDFTKAIIKSFDKGKSKINSILDRSLRKKIRKIFARIIENYRRTGVEIMPSDTPEQMAKKIRGKQDIDISRVVEIYGKARYSNQNCSEQELTEIEQYL